MKHIRILLYYIYINNKIITTVCCLNFCNPNIVADVHEGYETKTKIMEIINCTDYKATCERPEFVQLIGVGQFILDM